MVPDVARWLAAPWSVDRRSAAEALGALGAAEGIAPLAAQAREETDASVRAVLWHADETPGVNWGGVVVSHGFVLSPTVGGPNGDSGQLFAYRLPAGAG